MNSIDPPLSMLPLVELNAADCQPMQTSQESIYRELWRVLRKRKAIIFVTSLIFLGAGIGISLMMTPKYEAVATIEINKDSNDLLAVDQMGRPATAEMPDSLEAAIVTQTEANAIRSDSLLFQTAKQLRLEQTRDFSLFTHGPSDLYGLFDLDHHSLAREMKLPLEESARRQYLIHKAFEKNLRVGPVPGTRLVEIHFLDPNPKLAADVVNTLVNNYVEQRFRARSTATAQVSDWLSKQLDDLKNQVEATEQKLNQAQHEAGILGPNETNNVVMTRLEDLNRQLTAAEANRIVRETIYHLARSGDPELISMADTSFSSDQKSSNDRTQLNLVQELRAQEAQLKTQYAQASAKFGSAYPLVIQLRSQLAELGNTIQTEVRKMAVRAENDFVSAKRAEDQLRESFQRQKLEATKLNDKAVQLGVLKVEAESGRKLYDDLLTKVKVGDIVAALRSTNISVIDPARPAFKPKRPNFLINVLAALFAGLTTGLGLAFLRESMDDTVHTPKQLDDVFHHRSTVIIPDVTSCVSGYASYFHGNCSTNFLDAPEQFREAYRSLRASVEGLNGHSQPKVIAVTSALPEEGKTTTSLNLALALAEHSKKVLLIEADLRRPRLRQTLEFSNVPGLNEAVAKTDDPAVHLAHHKDLKNLQILSSGEGELSPTEVLSSARFAALIDIWRKTFDFVVIDTPPLLAFSDALLAFRRADAVLHVVRAGSTTTVASMRTREILDRARIPVLGIVLNRVDLRSAEHTDYVGFSNRLYSKYYAITLAKGAGSETVTRNRIIG